MKPSLSEDIIPVSEFKKNTASYLKEIRSKGRAIVLTQNGHSAAVVLSPEAFERLDYNRELLAAIAKGEKEIDSGKGVPHDQIFKKLQRSPAKRP